MNSQIALSQALRPHEQFLVRIEQCPWSAVYRIGIGYVLLPAYYQLFGHNEPDLHLLIWFLAVLFLLRLLPGVLRKALPFSQEMREIWKERRQIAKHHDSYQWEKLIWFGFGLAAYALSLGNIGSTASALTGFCLIGGGLGLYFSRRSKVSDLPGRRLQERIT